MKNQNHPQKIPIGKARFKQTFVEFGLLIKSIPPLVFAMFVVALFSMNLMANKSIAVPFENFALDCGLVVSWLVFLILDILTKHFGPKAATQLSIFSTFLNLIICGLFFIVSIIPGSWGEAYVEGSETIINTALNNTFGGSWYIIFGSAFAFIVSAAVNNTVNFLVGKAFIKNPDGPLAYLSRAYISTVLAQFTDNFIFALTVSRVFFGWSLIQCITCSLFGMLVELVCEVIFSLFGYKICESWRKNKVGEEYLRYIKKGAE